MKPPSAGPVSISVAKGPTQTILFIPSGALPNSSVVLQAIVLPNGAIDPIGTVQFFTGKTAVGIPVQVKNLIATLTTTQLSYLSTDTPVRGGKPVEGTGWGLVVYRSRNRNRCPGERCKNEGELPCRKGL